MSDQGQGPRFEALGGKSDRQNVFEIRRGCEYEIYGKRYLRTSGGAVCLDPDGRGHDLPLAVTCCETGRILTNPDGTPYTGKVDPRTLEPGEYRNERGLHCQKTESGAWYTRTPETPDWARLDGEPFTEITHRIHWQ